MVNLIGEKGFEGKVKYEGLEDAIAISGVYPHFYGKSLTKPFRKMGHVTVLAEDRESALQKAKAIKAIIKVIS
jgi:5-(carboxyamino)imidazole ribonucleotide synthase